MRQVVRPKVEVERNETPRKRAVKLLMDLRPEAQKNRSPGPSKTMYRLTRIWKKTWVRRGALFAPWGLNCPARRLGRHGGMEDPA